MIQTLKTEAAYHAYRGVITRGEFHGACDASRSDMATAGRSPPTERTSALQTL